MKEKGIIMPKMLFDKERNEWVTEEDYYYLQEQKQKDKERESALIQLEPLALRVLADCHDYEAHRAIDDIFEKSAQFLIDAEWADGNGNCINFTDLPSGLVIETCGSSANFRVSFVAVFTAEQAESRAEGLNQFEKEAWEEDDDESLSSGDWDDIEAYNYPVDRLR